MLRNPKKGEYALNLKTGKVGRICEVKEYWGWFKVSYYKEKRVYTYQLLNRKNTSFIRMSKEALADYHLNMENKGISNSWQE